MIKNPTHYKHSRGAVLLLLLLIMLVGTATLLVNRIDNKVSVQSTIKTTLALKKAKQALIDYAATYYFRNNFNRFGFLPCPYTAASPNEGIEAGNCGAQNISALGGLPWRTLGINAPLDSSAECLWYGVSGFYKNGNSPTPPKITPRVRTEMLNEDTNGAFQIAKSDGVLQVGATPQSRVVAVIIAPQAPIAGQGARGAKAANNLCSPDFTAANFLDNFNGVSNSNISNVPSAIDDFIRGDFSSKDKLNDRVITITRDEIFNKIVSSKAFNRIKNRTLQALAQCLVDYSNLVGDKSFPWPAPIALVNYRKDNSYSDGLSIQNFAFGRYPYVVNNSLLASGKIITDQNLDADGARSSGVNVDLFDQCGLADISVVERLFWKHWKDHFFYAVSEKFKPDAKAPNTDCKVVGDCLTVNGVGQYPALVFYSGSRLAAQVRNAPIPAPDVDTKQDVANYLEGRNVSVYPYTDGTLDYQSDLVPSKNYNDSIVCIDTGLNVLPVGGC